MAPGGILQLDPVELDESARVDGATPGQIFWGVILPLSAPVLAVIGLLSFVSTLNEYIIASQLLQAPKNYTLSVGLYGFISDQFGQEWGPFCAGVVLAAVPVGADLHRAPALDRRRAHPGRGEGMTTARAPLAAPHHDGSELYVHEVPSELGDDTVRLRVPRASAVDAVAVRYVTDGEPHVAIAEVDEEDEGETWWRASFPVDNPATPYRWLLSGGVIGYGWVTGDGLVGHDVPDADDFVCAVGDDGPAWHVEGVVYEVFPDRFARSGVERTPPEWAVPRGWDDDPTGSGPTTPLEWFGGDLGGIEAHLDHLERLGVSILYTTPFFPARSNHRYNATSFDEVDPLLGGDEALVSLVRAAHARGIRVIGDLTINHIGDDHAWFTSAQGGEDSVERRFFWFDDGLRHGYEAWAGVRTLPKLDHRDALLRERLLGDAESVVLRWLRPPFDLDGWRLDVANMAGRRGDVDVAPRSRVRRASRRSRPGRTPCSSRSTRTTRGATSRATAGTGRWRTWASRAPRGNGFAATCCRPSSNSASSASRSRCRASTARPSRRRCAASGRASRGARCCTAGSCSSHDIARFKVVSGSRERHLVGVGLQMTTPGVPMVFAGDELGLEGRWGEDARRPMPWDRPEAWDAELLAAYRTLIGLRRSSAALTRGGIRFAHVGPDAIAYLRETRGERLLCLATRAATGDVRLPLAALRTGALEPLSGRKPDRR